MRLTVAGVGAALVVLAGAGAACLPPCEAQVDCPERSYCSDEGQCQTDCTNDQDCAADQTCSLDGRCQVGSRPLVRFVSPAPDAYVEGAFDVEVEVTFKGRAADVRLRLDGAEPGGAAGCGAFFPSAQSLLGEALTETVQVVRFSDVRASGAAFTLRAEANTALAPDDLGGATLRLTGPADDQLDGVEILRPASPVVADDAVLGRLDVAFHRDVGAVWGTVTPFAGFPGPTRLLAEGAAIDDVAVLLARGRQVVELETDVGRCEVPVEVPPAGFGGVEAGLAFFSSAPTSLKLVVYTERDDGVQVVCEEAGGGPGCGATGGSLGVASAGHKWNRFDADDGVYGIAVVPGAVSPQVRAELRLSRDDAHVAFLGPRLLDPNAGEIWLAARLYVIDGRLTIESLDRLTTEVPPTLPSAW